MIVTIDGPAGCGKSTVAKMLANKTGFIFFDTGAMYRAVTYMLLKLDIPFTDKEKIAEILKSNFAFRIELHAQERRYFVDNEDVTSEIRGQLVTKHVSEVAALSVVREALAMLQRRFSQGINAIFEGRDLGTVVFPQAELKVFLTARPEVRAERRFREFLFKYPSEAENLTKQQVLEDILRRDTHDTSRTISPLKPADDAHIVDTSDLTAEEVVEKIFQLLMHLLPHPPKVV